MTSQLIYTQGETDSFNNPITEDRYIILDENGFDVYGEHFDLNTTNDLLNY